MKRVFARQLSRVTSASGAVDLATLADRVVATYDDFERDRKRVERANDLMSAELNQANARLGKLVDELQVQNQRFEAALDNMSQGLCLFGPDHRLVVCNERFTRMFELSEPSTLVGMGLDDFIGRASAFRSMTSDSLRRAESYLALACRQQHDVLNLEFADGRIALVVHEPMAGGGFVHTFEDVTARRQAEDKIVHLATHDVLTDLPNRLLLRQRLQAAVSGVADVAAQPNCAVMCLDLDRFKPVNDALGHAAGDMLLQRVTRRLRESVRAVDTVARLGGDEFAIVVPGVANREAAAVLAERIVGEVSRPYDIGGNSVVIGVSVGIAMAPGNGLDPERLISSADMALYHAKKEGRGRFSFFEPEMDALAQTRRALETDLRQAVERQEFELHYQPLIEIESRRVCGFEALVRWNSPTRGRVMPDTFIPLSEELGLIVPIGEWVLRRACQAAAKWPADIKLAVNVSARQFSSGTLYQSVVDALRDSGLAARRLELEITESVLMETEAGALNVLYQLRELGISIVMDDFGTGYSSLAYLRSFPFDKVKIDRSFVNGLGRQADAMAIVRAITGLCNSLGIPSTAEGVETGEQLELLGREHCTQVQGYLMSKPRPEADIPQVLDLLREPQGPHGPHGPHDEPTGVTGSASVTPGGLVR